MGVGRGVGGTGGVGRGRDDGWSSNTKWDGRAGGQVGGLKGKGREERMPATEAERWKSRRGWRH